MVCWKHSGPSVQEPSTSQSVRAIATRGDRARRLSAANARIARYALPVSATACLASALSPVLGGAGALGSISLAAGAIAAGLMVLAARYHPRVLRDDAVADLDRAAALDGSLRSAHWFAVNTPAEAADWNDPWISRHLEDAARRAAGVDWGRVYRRPSPQLRWALTVTCAVLAVGLSVRPLPRLVRRTAQPPATTRSPIAGPQELSASLDPQIIEGMKAMRAGRTPSEEQLSAIGEVLETAKHDAVARKRIEAEVNGSESKAADARQSSPSDSDAAWSDDYHNGFEMSDLDWAYQEALARGRSEEATRAEPGGEVTPPPGAGEPKGQGRQGEPAASGELSGSPVEGDTRGNPASFSSLLVGNQHAKGEPGAPERANDAGRAAKLAAALRTEVVHASSEVTLPDLDAPAPRRATNASRTPAAAPVMRDGVPYDRSRAAQPPAVPDARRPLLRGFFLRPAEPVPPVKRP
jgi:hypothetical protein